jgi:hypothetical protein
MTMHGLSLSTRLQATEPRIVATQLSFDRFSVTNDSFYGTIRNCLELAGSLLNATRLVPPWVPTVIDVLSGLTGDKTANSSVGSGFSASNIFASLSGILLSSAILLAISLMFLLAESPASYS